MMRLAGTIGRMPRYARLTRALFDEPAITRKRKLALAAGIGYAILPFDLFPGIIPVIGQLDDLGALLFGLRYTLQGCAPDIANRHLSATGVTREMLDEDLRTVGVSALWIGRTAVRGGKALIGGASRLIRSVLSPRR